MDWAQDSKGRKEIANDGADRVVAVGGDPAKFGGKAAPILYGRCFRPAGGDSLFRHERAAGLSRVPDDEAWVSWNHVASKPDTIRTDIGKGLWLPGDATDGGVVDHHEYYPTEAGTEWELHLVREPERWGANDKLRFVPLDLKLSPGLVMYYQPELTPEEIDGGDNRPENVVDSWAIYSAKAGNWNRLDGSRIVHYSSGKVGHLFRPWLLDAHGERHWCSWAVRDGLPIGVLIPAGLAYPAVLGPSYFGNDLGATDHTTDIDYSYLATTLDTAPAANGTLDSVDFYCRENSDTFRGALYDADENVIGSGSEVTSSGAPAWIASPCAGSVVAATAYQLAAWWKTTCPSKRDTGASGSMWYKGNTYHATNAFPNAAWWAGSTKTSTWILSIRGTYTESGGGGYTLTAGTGAFSESGQAAGLRAARELTVAAGGFSESGKAAALRAARKTSVAVGAFALAGQAANLRATRSIAAAAGPCALAGQVAGLRAARRLAMGAGAYVLSGKAVNLVSPSSVAGHPRRHYQFIPHSLA